MIFRRARRFANDRAGASAVEFALLAGPLCLMILGSLEFGRIYWTQQVLQETAIAGARCMGIPQTGCTVSGAYNASQTVSFIRTQAQSRGVALTVANVTVNHAATCSSISGFSSVTVNYTFQTALPSFLTALVTKKTMTATACFPNQAT